MTDTGANNGLLKCVLHVLGRLAVPPEQVLEIIGRKPKYLAAYNLCDGTLSQKEVVKKSGLRQSNFSVASKRWVENGLAFWLGEGKNRRLLHLYPVSKTVRGARSKI